MKNRLIAPMVEPEPVGVEIADVRLFVPAIGGESLSGLWGIGVVHRACDDKPLKQGVEALWLDTASDLRTPAEDCVFDHVVYLLVKATCSTPFQKTRLNTTFPEAFLSSRPRVRPE